MRVFLTFVALLLACPACAEAEAPVNSPVRKHGRLRVKGNRIVDKEVAGLAFFDGESLDRVGLDPPQVLRPVERHLDGAEGVVPEVKTAPVAMTLMKSAPFASRSCTRKRTSCSSSATPRRISSGTTVPSGRPVTSPPPFVTVI